jgi:hypothetical protein
VFSRKVPYKRRSHVLWIKEESVASKVQWVDRSNAAYQLIDQDLKIMHSLRKGICPVKCDIWARVS